MDLPQLLRSERAKRRLSQERVAPSLGVSFYRYRRIEAGLDRPTEDEAAALAQYFGLSARKVRSAIAATVLPRAGNGEAASVA